MTSDAPTSLAVAIIGMAGRFPGAPDVPAFWRNLRDGVESVSVLTEEQLVAAGIERSLFTRPAYVRRRAVLDGADQFDAEMFGISPHDAAALDPQHRVLLECAWEAFESAGYDPARLDRRVGVYAGSSTTGYLSHLFPDGLRIDSAAELAALLAIDKDFLTTRISYKLGLEGPSMAVQTACSTSLVAVHLAVQALLNGECDLALAGGVSIGVPQHAGYLYQEGAIGAPDGRCRTFDAEARGTVAGSGAGLVLLKRLDDALEDRDSIIAVIKGSAVNNDGRAKPGFTAPRVDGQARVIQDALAAAMVDADSISYVEAHGTGTPLGDPIEVAALTQAFRATTERRGYCALGSVKTNIGHLDAAAGVAGLIKAALALAHRQIPASLHFRSPNPAIDFAASPFFVATELRAWPSSDGQPRRAGVSSFGLGGTNAHVVLEESPAAATVASTAGAGELLVLSARSPTSLAQLSDALAVALDEQPQLALPDIAHTLRVGRRAFPHRRAVVGATREEIARALRATATSDVASSRRMVVFGFPGQGAQRVGMARELYQGEPRFRQEVDRCAALLRGELDVDLRAVLFPAAADAVAAAARLDRTSVTQPALFVVEYALAQLWMSWGVTPSAMIGHSIGEYVAACLAGCMSVEDALAVVTARGRLMEATPVGAMLAVAASEVDVAELLSGEVALAAVNGPKQCVLSGAVDAVVAIERIVAARGIQARRVRTERAFHSHLMDGALGAFREVVARVSLRTPALPWISNLSGSWITEEEVCDPDYWVRHVRGTVRFADGLRTLQAQADRIFLEVGPGTTLARLCRQVGGVEDPRTIASMPDDGSARTRVLEALGALWAQGVAVDWPRFDAGADRRRVTLPTTPFERQRHWIDASPRHGRAADIDDWFYVPSWKRAPLASSDAAPRAHWLVFADDGDLTAAQVEQLEAISERVTRVQAGAAFARVAADAFVMRPDAPEDYQALLGALGADHRPTHVLHAWSLTHVGFPEAQRRGAASLAWLAQALGRGPGGTVIVALAAGLHDLTGSETLRPACATLLGVGRTISRELPQLRCRVVELEAAGDEVASAAWLVDRIARETVELRAAPAGADPVVAYRGAHRWVPTLERTRLAPVVDRAAQLRPGGVYLITGGLGGIGLRIADELARAAQARLILVGRTAPTEAQLVQVRALERLGAEVLVQSADVTDVAQMQAVVAESLVRFGALHGVVHAAGVAGGGLIERLTPAALDAELAGAKTIGTLVLEEVIGGCQPDFLLLCSSLTSLSGGIAHAGYAAANAFLDVFAQDRARRAGPYVVSVSFDRWREVGMAARAFARLRALGIDDAMSSGMSPAQGQEVVRRVLGQRQLAHVVVSTRTLHGLPDDDEGRLLATRLGAGQAATPRPAASDATITARMAAIWARALGLEEVGIDADFFTLGGESLLALQILNQIRDAFGVELTVRDFFANPTVAGLAARVDGGAVQASTAPTASAEPALVALPRTARRLS